MNYKLLCRADIISFDIFDTLLIRYVRKPDDIFSIIEKKYGFIDFHRRRVDAGIKASGKAQNGEATFDEIYSYLSEDSRIELELEKEYLQANPAILSVFKWCKKHGKKIIAVSDMYLPSSFLLEVLSQNGFEIDRIYVSCEWKCNKRSGEIFDKVLGDLGCRPKNIVHIGDSWKSDYISPKRKGIEAIHINKRSYSDNILTCISENCLEENYFTKLGYDTLGPLLAGFTRWLNKQCSEKKIDKILFFARDGKIIKETYDVLYSHDTEYVYVSRQSLNTAALWLHPEFEDLKKYIIVTKSFTLSTFVKRIGLNCDDCVGELEQARLSLTDEFDEKEFWNNNNVKLFYNLIKHKAINNSIGQYKAFAAYIAPFLDKDNIGLVDIGWKGSIQKRFEELINTMEGFKKTKFYGFYYGIEHNASNVEGYLYKAQSGAKSKIVIDAGFGLVETFFLAREGSTLKYSSTGVVLDQYEINDENELNKLKNIHLGAIQYIKKICKLKLQFQDWVWDGFEPFNMFANLVLNPSRTDLYELGKLGFKDSIDTVLIEKKGLMEYILHSSRLKIDYHKAPWKIGFLKTNISSIVPWKSIYFFIKER